MHACGAREAAGIGCVGIILLGRECKWELRLLNVFFAQAALETIMLDFLERI
jgi:hypothetical protein